MLSLYIHIPFCHHKCGYCSFNVIPLYSLNQISPQPLSLAGEELQANGKKLLKKNDVLWSSLSDRRGNEGEVGLGGGIISGYLRALHKQIDEFSEKSGDQEIRTLYFGGGTPSTIGSEEMCKLIDHIASVRNLEYLEELSIEINPEPVDQMLDLISTISNRYKHFHRVRFSIGIQSFDNEVLEESGRKYNFQSCVDFLRKLTHIKMEHNVFNFDFIAFGKFNQTRKGDLQLRDSARLDFFERFVHSGFADSFSLYTLELFEGSEWFNQQIAKHNHEKAGFGLKKYGTDDDVYEEFELLKNIILEAGYQRYEISNYSKSGVNSIHNRIYRGMEERLGLGTGATSHLKKENLDKILPNLIRNTQNGELYSGHISIVPDLKRFTTGDRIDDKKTELLTETDYLKEKFLMGMRTMEGVQLGENITTTEVKLQTQKDRIEKPSYHHSTKNISSGMTDILVPNREEKIALFEEQELCIYNNKRLKLTDQGMDVYNSIITELMI